jgi:hypothetical protein
MFHALMRFLYWVPVLGRMLREAVEGPVQATYLFIANLLMTVALLVIVFGIRAIVPVALAGVAVMFISILDITRDPA